MRKDSIKIGISFNPYGHTYGRYGEEKFIRLKEQGYAAADYNLANTNTAIYALDEQELERYAEAEKTAAHKAGVTISQVLGPWRWPPQDGTEAQRAERLDKMKKAVIIAALMDCKHLVIHPIMPWGEEDLTLGKEAETLALNVAFFTSLANFAKAYDVIICVENMPMRRFSLATPSQLLTLVNAVGSDHLKVCLDTGHVAVFPTLSLGDEVRKLGDHIRVLHLHDNGGEHDSHAYPTEGIIDWADFFRALEDIRFDGVLSLETAPSGGLDDREFAAESTRLNHLLWTLATGEEGI